MDQLTDTLGGKLAELIDAHRGLIADHDQAREAAKAAEQAVPHAEAHDVALEATRLRLGDDADGDDIETPAAIAARDEATHRVTVFQAAIIQSVGAITDFIKEHGDGYTARLEKREQAARLAGMNALRKVESNLADLTTAQAARQWLSDPVTNSGQLRPLPAQQVGSTVTRPGGEPYPVNTLTAGLLEVFDPPVTQQGDQRAPWGIPTGAVRPVAVGGEIAEPLPQWKAGVMSTAAARVFGEQAAEALAS
jgi:hypothetical protein